MSYGMSVAERAILVLDRFLGGAITFVWTSTSTLHHRDARPVSPKRQQPLPEEDYGGGDICSLESPPTDDDLLLD
jgi:hypothetical protein